MRCLEPLTGPTCRIEIVDDITRIEASKWNALVLDNNPFVRHEFLAALEIHSCVGHAFGWLPRHIVIYQADRLVAAMPLYEKFNSYGEFVFDYAWADAYQRLGMHYYPKLVSAIPYTPAAGQRLLCHSEHQTWARPQLLQAAIGLARELGVSTLHLLFLTADEHQWLESQQLISRHDCQYHWHNRSYLHFEHFLATLNHRKRKNIRQERRKVQQAGIQIHRLDGHSATPEHWQRFTQFYQHTFEEKWGVPTLNQGFFQAVAEALPDQVVLVLAERNGTTIAAALMYRSDSVLYGRHWGCSEAVHSLHFEVCYYQGIEYAIEHGLSCFEPGAQGEHKMARGFVPTITRSSHWLADERLRRPIEQFCLHERAAIAEYICQAEQQLPYRQESCV